MKCPQCAKTKEASRCYGNNRISNSTALGTEYWDEDGIFHRHDPNWSVKSYHCSRGHCWTVKSRHPCPACTFGHSEPETRILNPT